VQLSDPTVHCRKRTTLISHQRRGPCLANGMLGVWLHGIPLFWPVTTVVSACQGLSQAKAPKRQGNIYRGRVQQGTPSKGMLPATFEILLPIYRDRAYPCHPTLSSTCQPMLRVRMPLSRGCSCALPLLQKINKSTTIMQTNYLAI
jgi:hypothetical protein